MFQGSGPGRQEHHQQGYQGGKPSWGQTQGHHQQSDQVQPVHHQQVSVEPPKATVTLLQQPPISQQPPPVFASQPATASMKGGARCRGDQKWPPETVKMQAAEENAQRIALAKGPACRPRRVRKDYSQFFAQHALNPTYPGYRAPPGTQHYIEEGTSNL
ncbi:hypothetical protein AAG570_006679 [Ranatra chinensis]|uniref:Uncharacterized protein n=1 Tax=Ranatra chinensis TaxID=642074 RepID=A0ABD0YVC4_9HEMI